MIHSITNMLGVWDADGDQIVCRKHQVNHQINYVNWTLTIVARQRREVQFFLPLTLTLGRAR